MAKNSESHPLNIIDFSIDDHCVGSKWTVDDEDRLARLIAIVLMGQAMQAAQIIDDLLPATPAFTHEALQNEAIIKLTVQEEKKIPRTGYPRHQRDGLIFEIISWIAAKQVSGDRCFLKDPHISATSQGLDGLMIELNDEGNEILKSTIFEDKCTEYPRDTFRDHVMPGFMDRHENTRSSELVTTAGSLIKMCGAAHKEVMAMAIKVLDNDCRQYRAAFALTNEFDNNKYQKSLFKGYDKLSGINSDQRIGASLIVGEKLRDWFDAMSERIVAYIQQLDEGQV